MPLFHTLELADTPRGTSPVSQPTGRGFLVQQARLIVLQNPCPDVASVSDATRFMPHSSWMKFSPTSAHPCYRFPYYGSPKVTRSQLFEQFNQRALSIQAGSVVFEKHKPPSPSRWLFQKCLSLIRLSVSEHGTHCRADGWAQKLLRAQ